MDKLIHHDILGKLWETVGADVFTLSNKYILCTVDYHSKFQVIKQIAGFSADNLIKTCKVTFSEHGLPSKLMSDTDTNFTLENFQEFHRCLNIHNAVIIIQSPEQWTGRSVHLICHMYCKKCYDANTDICLALLQICSTPLEPGSLSPAALLFNRPVRGILAKLSRPHALFNQDDYYQALIKENPRLITYKVLEKSPIFI